MNNVLLAASDSIQADFWFNKIKSLGLNCTSAFGKNKVIEAIRRANPSIVFVENQSDLPSGLDILDSVKELKVKVPIVFCTNIYNEEFSDRVIRAGAFDCLNDPNDSDKLRSVIDNAICSHRNPANTNNNVIQKSFLLRNIIGKSELMQGVAKRVLKVSSTDTNVLVYGESGTGKELIAQSIHYYSNRHKRPFIPVDCVALPPTLLESELFGYEKGAFTGAVREKPGLIELADHGTIFLDEIAELDMYLQAKLLRVLQERQFRRVGGKKLINVNIRIISATNWNPEEAVNKEKLRRDLYYRINVVPIYLPPLRERKEDIPYLTYSFVTDFNSSYNYQIERIDDAAMECLKRYNWPGNIRELQNVIERAMSLAEGDKITVNDLPENIQNNSELISYSNSDLTFKEARDLYVKKFYKNYFERLIQKYNGNISKIARESKLSRATIYRLLDEAEIQYKDNQSI